MLPFETVLTSVVMAAWLLVLCALYRRFRRQEVAPLPAGLAAAAVALGLLSAIPGLLHTVAVAGGAVNNHTSYDLRLAWLLTVGLILMYSGSVNVLLSSRIKRSDPWAVTMSASATALLVAFLAVLHPAKPQTLLMLNSPYLGLLLVRLCRPQTGHRVRSRKAATGQVATHMGVRGSITAASCRDELELLVEAGLTPAATLGAATLAPARFLNREAELGTIEQGKRADLVLLEANPLADIRNTRRIVSVKRAWPGFLARRT